MESDNVKSRQEIEARIHYLLNKSFSSTEEKLWIGGQINALRWALNLVIYPEEVK